jgi:hypothetical protein
MAYQIYAISDSFNKNGSFFLRTHIINSSSKEASQRIFPITKIPKLSMGTQYKEDSTINCELDDSNSVDIMFEKFNEGKIVCLKDLPSISNAFLPDQDSLVNAKYYLVKSENSTYAFPCYELFRTFFCVDNRIINHLFQYDQLESLLIMIMEE